MQHPAQQLAQQTRPLQYVLRLQDENPGRFILGASDSAIVTTGQDEAFLMFGRPRSFKTTALIVNNIISAFSPVLTMSIKNDIMKATAMVRSLVGPVWHFDLGGEGTPDGIRKLRWSPLDGCEVWDYSRKVMSQVVEASQAGGVGEQGKNSKHFLTLSYMFLAALAHYAARSGKTWRWVCENGRLIDPKVIAEAAAWLRDHGSGAAGDSLIMILKLDPEQRAGVFGSIAVTLECFLSDTLLDLTDDPNFDPREAVKGEALDEVNPDLILSEPVGEVTKPDSAMALKGRFSTIYITSLDPEMSTTYVILFVLRMTEAAYQQKRMDDLVGVKRPALAIIGDEAGLTAPVPRMPRILATGGENVNTLLSFQSPGQMRGTWGSEVGNSMLTIAPNVGLAPGLRSEDLPLFAGLGGDRYHTTFTATLSKSDDGAGDKASSQVGHEKYPSLTPADLYNAHPDSPDLYFLFAPEGGYRRLYAMPYYRAKPWPQLLVRAAAQVVEIEDERVQLPLPDLDRDGDGRWLKKAGVYDEWLDVIGRRAEILGRDAT